MARLPASRAALSIRDLQVYYGASHALQGVDLTLETGVHAVVGRNGMGKTTLCNAIMGLVPVRSGSIRVAEQEVNGLAPHQISKLGVGYTPQGRRLWQSLSVDEHLRLCEVKNGSWSIERIYETFPRLAERRHNGGGQLSGGEQQMLAISRALLHDPRLLILDEPTEGLAPVIVAQVEELLHKLADTADVAILLIEQNIGVATRVADDISIMVNGVITTQMDAAELGKDRELQQRLLGVGREELSSTPTASVVTKASVKSGAADKSVEQSDSVTTESKKKTAIPAVNQSGYVAPTRWSRASWENQDSNEATNVRQSTIPPSIQHDVQPMFRDSLTSQVLVAGTFDTKARELGFIVGRLASHDIKVTTVDLSTSGKPSSARIAPHHVAAYHPQGASAVFGTDRGKSITEMAVAFVNWMRAHPQVSGIISAAGSGGTALVTPAMRELSIGVPKIMISTVASGNVAPYVGPSDIMMMYSVTDVQGINSISRQVLGNGADALAGMLGAQPEAPLEGQKQAIGLSMFGLTTPAVQAVTKELDADYECLVFHATGIGGQSMEKLADSGFLTAAIDLTTTEVCDFMMGGVFACTEDRFGAFARTRIPYVGSIGALDMVNFGSPDTVPAKYASRQFVHHNPQVTLMRTTPEENQKMGQWIGAKLNAMDGPVRFLLPEGGVSGLDAPGQPFENEQARTALIEALEETVETTSDRQLIRHPAHINDPAFAALAVSAFKDLFVHTRSTLNAKN